MTSSLQLLSEALTKQKWTLVTAESCTAGGLAYALTAIPGTSTWFERGYVVYSNPSKKELLGVKEETLATFGAVSEQTAIEMAEGALEKSRAQMSISITGIAGPDGGTSDKPVGTVWFAFAGTQKKTLTYLEIFSGDRKAIREKSIQFAMEKALDFLKN